MAMGSNTVDSEDFGYVAASSVIESAARNDMLLDDGGKNL